MSDALAGIVKELPFSSTEYRDRCWRLRQLMVEGRLDVMLVHQPASVFYFSGNENLRLRCACSGRVGVAFSETVLITPTGCEALTRSERRLVVR